LRLYWIGNIFNGQPRYDKKMSSGELIRCKVCGQAFDTIDSIKEHEKSEEEDKELQNKGL
jgi:transcription initiation factor IIE alpha subunit